MAPLTPSTSFSTCFLVTLTTLPCLMIQFSSPPFSALSKGVQSFLTKMPLNSVQPCNFLASRSIPPTLLLSLNNMSRGRGSPVFLALSRLQDVTSTSTSSARPQRSVKKAESALILSFTSSALLSGTPNQIRFAFLHCLSRALICNFCCQNSFRLCFLILCQ